jgi:hypothetical protein
MGDAVDLAKSRQDAGATKKAALAVRRLGVVAVVKVEILQRSLWDRFRMTTLVQLALRNVMLSLLQVHEGDAEEDGGDAGPLKGRDAFLQENCGESDGDSAVERAEHADYGDLFDAHS